MRNATRLVPARGMLARNFVKVRRDVYQPVGVSSRRGCTMRLLAPSHSCAHDIQCTMLSGICIIYFKSEKRFFATLIYLLY